MGENTKEHVKALINMRDGTIQLEGPEKFVEKYLDQYKNIILTSAPIKTSKIADTTEKTTEKTSRKRQKKGTGQSCSPRIIELLSEGYFKEPRTRAEVQQELLNRGYRFEGREVSATLINYFTSGKLRRTGAGSTAKYYSNPE